MIADLIITPAAYPYLVVQRGALDDMRGDSDAWCQKYVDVLYSELEMIEPWLPKRCTAVLDVGGGMGGIDVLLHRRFPGCHVTILDGLDDPPKVERHAATFSNSAVASEFLWCNGVESIDFIDANAEAARATRLYDLVVSFRSWCFHVPPARYLDLVRSCCIPQHTKLIIDVRRDKPAWLHELLMTFGDARRIFRGPKTDTYLFEAP